MTIRTDYNDLAARLESGSAPMYESLLATRDVIISMYHIESLFID